MDTGTKVLIAIAIIAGLGVFGILMDSQSPEPTTQDVEIQDRTLSEYSDEARDGFRESFMEGCNGGTRADMEDYCSCAYSKIEKKYTPVELMKIYNEAPEGELPEEFMEAVSGCFSEIDSNVYHPNEI